MMNITTLARKFAADLLQMQQIEIFGSIKIVASGHG
jgi:hypothetical protein